MDAGTGATLVAIGALIAGLTGLIKSALPGDVSSKTALAICGLVALFALGLAYESAMLVGVTPFSLVATWVNLVLSAVGVREVATVPAVGGKTLENLPSRSG